MRRIIKKSLYSSIVAIFLISVLPYFSQPVNAASATLYLSPSSGTYVINSTFTVGVKVNSGSDVVNAAEGAITYDSSLLDVVGLSKGGSIFPFWTTEPSHSGGTIRFGGGLPPPAYNGTAGHLISITFKARQVGTARVAFSSGAVLANDGKGTNVLSSMGSANYTISPKVTAPTETKKEPIAVEPEYNQPKITSPTHPDQEKCYNSRDVKFVWELEKNINSVSLAFDQETVSDPGPQSDGLFDTKDYTTEDDGVYYFHLKLKDASRWGTIGHFQVNIDITSPLPFIVEVVDKGEGEWPELHFETKDDGSGLDKYEVFIGNIDKPAYELAPDKNMVTVSGLAIGEHTALVKAIDKAGNERVVTTQFKINPIEAPVIKYYPEEIKTTDRFYVNGTAAVSGSVNIYIQREGDLIATGTTAIDNNGNWFYLHEQSLDNNRYIFWVESVNLNGIKSWPSEKKTFLVSPPVFAVFGNYVINYFTVFVSLLFMLIIIVLAIFYIIAFIRKRLKKETKEIEEVLHKNAEEMKGVIDQEFINLSKKAGLPAERTRAKERLKQRVEENEKKTLKEIRDVEDMLK